MMWTVALEEVQDAEPVWVLRYNGARIAEVSTDWDGPGMDWKAWDAKDAAAANELARKLNSIRGDES
jgi:hypothetical protein